MKFNTSKVATIFLKNKFVGNKKSDVRENDGFIFMYIYETKNGPFSRTARKNKHEPNKIIYSFSYLHRLPTGR